MDTIQALLDDAYCFLVENSPPASMHKVMGESRLLSDLESKLFLEHYSKTLKVLTIWARKNAPLQQRDSESGV